MSNRVNRVRSLTSTSKTQSVGAEMYMRDIDSGDSWSVPILKCVVQYTRNMVPAAQIDIPLGKSVAQELSSGTLHTLDGNEFNLYWGDPHIYLGGIDIDDIPIPAQDTFYEIKIKVDNDGNGYTDGCLFWGYITDVNVSDSGQNTSGQRSLRVRAMGIAGLIQAVTNEIWREGNQSAWYGNPWGQDAGGHIKNSTKSGLESGSIGLHNFFRGVLKEVCDAHINNNPSSAARDSARLAKWAIDKLIDGSGYTLRSAFPDDVGESIAASMIRHIQQQDVGYQSASGNLWTSLLSFCSNEGMQNYGLSILCGVHSMKIAPVVRPEKTNYAEVFTSDDITSYRVVPGKSDFFVRGATMIHSGDTGAVSPWGMGNGQEPRVLSSVSLAGRPGQNDMVAKQTLGVQWIPNDSPSWTRKIAKQVLKQYVLDRQYEGVEVHVEVPFIDKTLPGSAIKIEDVYSFNNTSSNIWGGWSTSPESIYGTVKSTRVTLDATQPTIKTSFVISHAMSNETYYDVALPESDHFLCGSGETTFLGDFDDRVSSNIPDYNYSGISFASYDWDYPDLDNPDWDSFDWNYWD